MEEIFKKLATKLIEDIGDVQWEKVILDLIRLEGSVRFSAIFINESQSSDLEVSFGFWEARDVHKLYNITQSEPAVHTNWNRAKYTLFPDGKMEMEYIWDQELQDEVDGYNNDISPNSV